LLKPSKTRAVSNPLGLAILALLFERPMHPYEMATTLRERGKDRSIKLNYGSLYTIIGALERARLISPSEKNRQGARPERTVFTITLQGEAELLDWMRQLIRTPVKEFPQFEAALSLIGVLPPGEAKALLRERIRLLDAEIQDSRRVEEEAARQGVARLFLIEEEYHTAMCEAERKWVSHLVHLMTNSPAFTRGWRAWHAERKRRTTK
jgi:DNA-binding PadR family transcriptional regulator